LLAPYRVILTIPVAWGEMDAYQHVNNIIYLRYFESVRMAYFEQCGFHAHHQQFGVGPILAETACKFLKPLTYPDTVLAAARVTALSEDRFHQEYALVSKKENRLCAVGHGVIVSYDYRALQKTKLPPTIVKQMEILEGVTSWPALP